MTRIGSVELIWKDADFELVLSDNCIKFLLEVIKLKFILILVPAPINPK